MAIKYLAGERLIGTTAERTALETVSLTPIPQTSWKELDRVTLGSSGDSMDTGTFAAKDNLMILEHIIPTGGAVTSGCRFNGDSGNNYAYRRSTNSGSEGSEGSLGYDAGSGAPSVTYDIFCVMNIKNVSNQEKIFNTDLQWAQSGASNAPNRREAVGKWANTSDAITRIEVFNGDSGSYAAGSELIVLGCDDDEADSGTNFWQELATTSTSGAETLSPSFTAKKYLMMEAFTITSSGSARFRMGSGGSLDSGSNYATRVSSNGGATDVATSHGGNSLTSNTPIHWKMFFINKADKEKLWFEHASRQLTAGASNVPGRVEEAGKWANTSAQANIMGFVASGQTFSAGSTIRVWGSD